MLLNKILGDFLTISPSEMEILSELDCKKFGHLKLNDESNLRKKKIALKAVAFLEHALSAHQEAKRRQQQRSRKRKLSGNPDSKDSSSAGPKPIDPSIYKKLGHLHLLLENYNKSLSAYEKYSSLVNPKKVNNDVDFLYGRGLIYFHFGAYHLAVRTLQQVIYMDPSYQRASDIHVRLGLMRKMMKNYATSLKHFNMALRIPNPCSFSKDEIRFHVAHLHEVEGKSSKALELYNELLQSGAKLSNTIKAEIHRQIGWMYYSLESFGDKQTRIPVAIQHLQKSMELDSKSGQCLYLLGRCFASIGKVHDAFVAYRNSVDKSESNADTWCSIGVLYQQQKRPAR